MTDDDIKRLYGTWVECLPWSALFLRYGNVSGAFEHHKACQDIATEMLKIDHERISTMSAEVAGMVWAVRMWAEIRPHH